MKKVVFAIFFATMFIAAMEPSYAETLELPGGIRLRLETGDWHGGIRSRIEAAQQRIEQGVEQGSLTRHEAGRLQGELSSILEKIDYMKQDGRLDEREREIVNRNLDRLEMDISREKHDDEMAPRYGESRDWHGAIRSRIEEAQQRIEQGVERGSLTGHEARRLQEELGGILEKIDYMKQDGRLDERERETVNRDLNRLDMDIAREKHDDERRRY